MAIHRDDPRFGKVEWRDLLQLSRVEQIWELSLTLPWLVGSIWAYGAGSLWWGVVMSFFLFLTGLRQSHDAQHGCLRIGRRGHDALLFGLSGLMLASMHAVRVTHLHHHRHCLEAEDVEASHVSHSWWQVLLMGPIFPIRLHAAAWRLGRPVDRRWIAAEFVFMAGILAFALASPGLPTLRLHLAAMLVGEAMTGFFAVWTVHHGCEADGQIARTQRGWLKNVLSYSMFFHLEHHLFPGVPTCKLARLAARLDRAAPDVQRMRVF